MIVVDSSVWIARIRGLRTPAVTRLDAIVDTSDVVVGDLVLLEVLQGARDGAHANQIARQLRRFQIVAMSSEALAIQAARDHRKLRDLGVTIRKTIDMIIGVFCIANGYPLLHDDRDFEPMARYLGLAVV